MSISSLTNAPWLSINCKSVTAEAHYTQDIDCENLQIGTSMSCKGISSFSDDISIYAPMTIQYPLTASGYIIPPSAGNPNQVIAMPSTGNQCIWATVGGESGLNSISNQDGNLQISDTNGNVAINVSSNLSINNQINCQNMTASGNIKSNSLMASNIAIGNSATNYQLPSAIGTNNYILTSNGTNAVWQPSQGGTGTITSIINSDNNIQIQDNSGTVNMNMNGVVSIATQINAPLMNCTNMTASGNITSNSLLASNVAIGNSTTNYQLPTTIGTNNYVLTSNGTNADGNHHKAERVR